MKKTIGIIIALSAILAGVLVMRFGTSQQDNETNLIPLENQPSLSELEPTIVKPEDIPVEHHPSKLSIPSLSLSDIEVQKVGLKENGDMANPTNFTDVGWFKLGVAPGYVGSAVLAGHVDNGKGKAGVFHDLHKLKIGDSIKVEREDGGRLQYKVTEIKSYPYDDAPLKDIFARSDKSRLNLITCIGDWLSEERTYTERLVVYTEIVQ